MPLCITCDILDDLEKLIHGQIDLENFQYLCNGLRYRLVVEKYISDDVIV